MRKDVAGRLWSGDCRYAGLVPATASWMVVIAAVAVVVVVVIVSVYVVVGVVFL